ncbi:MAG: UPF0280 family protein [Desulfomonile sp.]|jgi:ApbE superfamily uncharacterized protein (UPF0280 family)|nr:UPF0280 family protein [Deltaproteobacteria bacterium]
MTFPVVYEPRVYRDFNGLDRFKTFRVAVETSDLYVKAHSSLEAETERLIRECRAKIKQAIIRRPEFLTSLVPIEEDPLDSAVATRMVRAAKKAGTGPMAAVAGAVAEYVGQALLERSPEVIVENGGDIFLKVLEPTVVGLFAGDSPFSGRLGVRIESTPTPLGVCTSSGTVGPSLSFGTADAVVVISKDVPLADAVATAAGNIIHKPRDLKRAVELALKVPGIDGALAVLGDNLAALGEIELVPVHRADTAPNSRHIGDTKVAEGIER